MNSTSYIPLHLAAQVPQPRADRKDFDNSRMRQFAGRHRLRVKKDGCGEVVATGKHGHLFDYGDGECFGMVLEDNPPHLPSKAKALLSRRRQALAAGFTAHQRGECESILLFNPQDLEQVRLAITLVRARQRRVMSEAQREVAMLSLSRIRLRKLAPQMGV